MLGVIDKTNFTDYFNAFADFWLYRGDEGAGKPPKELTVKEMKDRLKEHMGDEKFKSETAKFDKRLGAGWEKLYNKEFREDADGPDASDGASSENVAKPAGAGEKRKPNRSLDESDGPSPEDAPKKAKKPKKAAVKRR
eukprot:TRINITY_DN4277_c0_g1_i2.p1 TRINITY_DN4277_c0_g1~~TRINITY_DN4277_c0_g1_i2.p1  ORF type:complete len:138 (+),score=33.31 TRINITY_DN4277_c0_g1_i2:498-911(+)